MASQGNSFWWFLFFHDASGSVHAIDINKGRLRILEETARLHNVDNVIKTVHADLRVFVVSNFFCLFFYGKTKLNSTVYW